MNLFDLPEFVEASIFSIAQVAGGNVGIAIVAISLVVRMALLPLTLRVARRSLQRQKRMEALRPTLELLRRKHGKDPRRLMEETSALLAEHGVSPVDRLAIAAIGLQLPIFLSLFGGIRRAAAAGGRFLWIVDLARPDVFLTLAASGLAWLSVSLSPGLVGQQKAIAVWLPTLLTLFFLWRLAAAVGLYWAASNAVGVLQSVLLKRLRKIEA